LWLAPFGVFGLAFAVGAGAGGAAFGAVLHYVVLASAMGLFVMLAGYGIALFGARWSLGQFARAMIPPQTVAISTQSSLASLPAMLTAAEELGVPEAVRDVSLPLAVALFRASGPAVNIAVAIYVAYWLQIDLTWWNIAAGIAVASVASYWAVSLPGALSFVTSIAPIALVMGLPIEPLALLIAVEVIPDIFRTLSNVTMDVAVTGAVARSGRDIGVDGTIEPSATA
jgi:Na+/H+-dicarboxylate symporter